MAIKIDLKKQLDNFALNVKFATDSRRIGILGASGCGKSMTLKGIAGVKKMDGGYVKIEDRLLYDDEKKINQKPQKRKIGYLFQNYALFPTMTVKENIMAGLHGKKREKEMQAKSMMKKFQLVGLEEHLPGELSGGQQQRTALARIMAYQPEVILLDEPFSALDEFLKERLEQEMLEMLRDYRGTVILVSHNRDEIYRFCEELLVMEKGQIVTQGLTREVFAHPETKTAARLTGCKNIADIEKIDQKHIRIPDWGCTIALSESMTNQEKNKYTAVGYRAHEFLPVWGERQPGCIPFRLESMANLPFERRYYLRGERGMEICWFVQKKSWKELDQKGLPDYLQMLPEKLLYLIK